MAPPLRRRCSGGLPPSLMLMMLPLVACVGLLTVPCHGQTFSVQLTPNYVFSWSIDQTTNIINMSVIVQGEAWVGFGLSPVTAGMANADIYVTRFDTNSSGVVEDRYAPQEGLPPTDVEQGGENNVLQYGAQQANNVTTSWWTRLLDTGDAKTDHVINSQPMNIIWAFGTSNTFGYHHNNRGIDCIDFFAGTKCAPPLSNLVVPLGFHIEYFATVFNARVMAMGGKDVLYVGTWTAGSVYGVNVTSRQTTQLLSGLSFPNGVAYHAPTGALFLSTTSQVLRFDNVDANPLSLPNPTVVYTFTSPPATDHNWKRLAIGPDDKLYIPLNSPCNTCYEPNYGLMLRMDLDGSNVTTVARGIRDTQGFDWHPLTKELWFTDNGRDYWGNLRPPDELNRVSAPNQHFGFPFCYGKDLADTQYNLNNSCTYYTPDVQDLQPHTAALGMKFYTGTMFPKSWQNVIFIAEHGSWNRQPPFGYRVTFVRLAEDNITPVDYDVFAAGWLLGTHVYGRPVDILQLADGSLLVSDDSRGYIYRIFYDGTL